MMAENLALRQQLIVLNRNPSRAPQLKTQDRWLLATVTGFIERFFRSVRNEFLDHTFFWNSQDLQTKLNQYKSYYNSTRGHWSLNHLTPNQQAECDSTPAKVESMRSLRWQSHCSGRYRQPGRHLRHCLFSLVRNPVQQHSISKEATEEFVGMELFVPGFEGERKRSTRPAMRALTAGTARACIHDLRFHDHFLDDQLLSTPHLYFLYLAPAIYCFL